MRIVDQCETEIHGDVIFQFIFEPGGGGGLHYFRSYITVCDSKYLLWAHSGVGMLGVSCAIDGLEISSGKVQEITDKLFPLSKWEIERRSVPTVDGPYLELGLSDMGDEVYLNCGSFSDDAAWDMVNTITAAID